MELRRASSVEEAATGEGLLLAGGTELVPLLRSGIVRAETLVDIRGVVPRGIDGSTIGAGTTLAELECDPQIPAALREACRLAASPQLRNVGSIGGNLLQSTRCWYWRLKWPCRLHGGDECFAHEGEHREHAIFANGFCASAHPSDVAAALVALDATIRTNRRELPVADLYRLPTADDRSVTTLEPGELLLSVQLPASEGSVYLKAMERKRWAFPLVGVAAARSGGATRIALAGVAPVPWLLDGGLDAATPLAAERLQGRRGEGARQAGRRGAGRKRVTPQVARCRSWRRSSWRSPAAAVGRSTRRRRRRRPTRTAASRSRHRRPTARHEAKPTARLVATKTYDVRFATNCGSFTIRLAVKTSPETTASFVSLVNKGYFDHTIFHRIVPGFVVQGGDPTATGTGGPGYTTVDPPPASTQYTLGVAAMAKAPSEPAGAAGSQFFVVTADRRAAAARLRGARTRSCEA